VIIPDINLLVYSYNSDAPEHRKARLWLESILSASQPVALPWVVILGFLRIMTSRRILISPLTMTEAVSHVRSWLEQSPAQIIHPGPRHLDLFEDLAARLRLAGEMTTGSSPCGVGDRTSGRIAFKRRGFQALSRPSVDQSLALSAMQRVA